MSYKLKKNVPIPMRDGIKLACDIYFPKEEKIKYPVIIERTPYGKESPIGYEIDNDFCELAERVDVASYYTKKGYIFIYQDCRGRFDSEGEFEKYINEAEDGTDTIDWIKNQSWCNGKIGLSGFSYTAHAAMAIGTQIKSGISCMFIDSGGFANAFQSGIRQNGTFELKQLIWAYHQGLDSIEANNNPIIKKSLQNEDLFAWMNKIVMKRKFSILRNLPLYEDAVFNFWEHGKFDNFWNNPVLNISQNYDNFIDIPLFLASGWYDPHVMSVVSNYIALSKKLKSTIYLMIGPWTHNNRAKTNAGEVDFTNNAKINFGDIKSYQELKQAWFDKNINDKKHLFDNQNPVRIFIMGGGTGRKNKNGTLDHGGKWVTSNSWPLPKTKYIPYYFTNNSCLSTRKDYAENKSITYEFDPKHPVPTIGGTITSGAPIMEGGAYNQIEKKDFFGSSGTNLPINARLDIVSFQTEILQKDIIIAGDIEAHLFVSSSCKDTDFTIKLIDEYPINIDYPNGFSMNITDGIQRMRYRNSYTHPELMIPGTIYEITIKAFPTANLFKRGHRIRLDISSSNYPHFDVNHNTGEPEGTGILMNKALNTIYIGGKYSSYINLPILNL